MTREEKIQKELDSKTREEKLNRMRESMWDWDSEYLIDLAIKHISDNMAELCNSDFDKEYYEWFAYEFEESDYDDDEENVVDAVVELQPLKCVCGSGGVGCYSWCDLITGERTEDAY